MHFKKIINDGHLCHYENHARTPKPGKGYLFRPCSREMGKKSLLRNVLIFFQVAPRWRQKPHSHTTKTQFFEQPEERMFVRHVFSYVVPRSNMNFCVRTNELRCERCLI